MNVPKPTRRDRAALLRGAVALAGLVLLSRGLPAWRAWVAEARGAAIEARRQAATARALGARRAETLGEVAAAHADYVALAPMLVDGRTPSGAAAALAALVSAAAEEAGLAVGSAQLTADTTASRVFARVGVRLSATGDVIGVARLLERLEGGPTLLSVPELAVDQPEPGAPAGQAEALRVQLHVQGLHLRAEGRQ